MLNDLRESFLETLSMFTFVIGGLVVASSIAYGLTLIIAGGNVWAVIIAAPVVVFLIGWGINFFLRVL